MAEQQIYFRPGLIIFMDKVGEHVYEHLISSRLLEHLDEPLRHCIGCARIVKENEQAERWLMSDVDPKTGKVANVPQDSLDKAVHDLLIRTMNRKSIQKCTDTGYQLGPRQIYLVSSTSPGEMHAILQIIQEQLHILNYTADISCIMLADAKTAVMQHKEIKVCYLFGDMPGAKNVPEDTFYIAAEALFALIATDITLKPEFQQTIQPWLDDITTAYATLSSCRFTFPYETIQNYSRAKIGQNLIDAWLEEIQQGQQYEPALQPESKEMHLATQAIKEIDRRLHNSEPLPDTYLNGIQSKWTKLVYRKNFSSMPTVDLWSHPELGKTGKAVGSQSEQLDLSEQLRTQTHQLFELISFQSIQKASQHSQTWTETAETQWKKLENEQKNWQDVATKAWSDAREKASTFIRQQVYDMWNTGTSMRSIIRYIDTIYEWLNKQEQILHSNDDSKIQQSSENNEADEPAEKYRKLSLAQQQVRTALFFPATGLLIIPVLILLIMTAITPLTNEQPQILLWLMLLSILCIILAGVIYFQMQQQRHVLPAQIELLNHYRNQLIQFCKEIEKQQRHAMILSLRQNMQCMTTAFLISVKAHFIEATTTAITTLTESLPASQDIFICNGEFFQNTARGHAVLTNLVQTITSEMNTSLSDQRKRTSFEQKSAEALLALLQRNSTDITPIEYYSSVDKLAQEDVLMPFLNQNNATLKSIGSIDEKLWRLVLERVQQPFSSVQTGMRKPVHIFLCGSNPIVNWVHLHRAETISVAAEPVYTKQSEWLLVVALYCTHAS